MTRLTIMGGGKMGEALLGGLLAAGWAQPSDIVVVEKVDDRRKELGERHPDVRMTDAPDRSDGVLLAVKPDDVDTACAAVGRAGCERLLSIVAGVTIARLEAGLASPGIRIVRAMPNTPALLGAGASAIAPSQTAADDDLEWAEGILGAVGKVVRVAEPLLDAVTGLSGSGPAYVFLVAEALIDAGVLAGLPRDTSRTLAIQTLLGSARLLDETGDSPEKLRAAVTSPGGTTAAGLRELERAGVRFAFLEAVMAATRRATEMGTSGHSSPSPLQSPHSE
jgi:pyrroline-5-carboxylate reductase